MENADGPFTTDTGPLTIDSNLPYERNGGSRLRGFPLVYRALPGKALLHQFLWCYLASIEVGFGTLYGCRSKF
jgi:hypothetical protein